MLAAIRQNGRGELRNPKRLLFATLAAASGIVFFTGLASMVHVRAAIAEGALESELMCLRLPDREKWDASHSQEVADWWIWRSVYEHHIGENRRPGVGWRGVFAYYGMKMAMSPSERVAMARGSIEARRHCSRRMGKQTVEPTK